MNFRSQHCVDELGRITLNLDILKNISLNIGDRISIFANTENKSIVAKPVDKNETIILFKTVELDSKNRILMSYGFLGEFKERYPYIESFKPEIKDNQLILEPQSSVNVDINDLKLERCSDDGRIKNFIKLPKHISQMLMIKENDLISLH